MSPAPHPALAVLRRGLLFRMLPLAGCVLILALGRALALPHGLSHDRGTAAAIGFLLLSGYVAGKAAVHARLPRITGYLLAGIALGPYGTGVLSHEMLGARGIVDGVAVALIALTAGGELEIAWLRRAIRRVATITFGELIVVFVGMFGTFLAVQHFFTVIPLEDIPPSSSALMVITMVFAVVAVTNSPSVTIAVINETRSEGPVTRTVLGVTILKDIAVIVFFALALAIARNTLGGAGDEPLWWTLTRELLGSTLLGLGFGALLIAYLRTIGRELPVFLLVFCLALAQTCRALHLEVLLAAVAAGCLVANFPGGHGHRVVAAIERVSLPVYALFFAGAGAKVRLDALGAIWMPAVALVVVRAALVYAGTRLGTTLAGAEPAVRRYAWVGFLSQAGVTLALAALISRSFPTWGPALEMMLISMIAIHELVGPPAFQWALGRAGEIGGADRPPEDEATG
ncbi:MAG: cation:proton antiporter [Deltaproteobacteria bacterium]|nr:cation:proton antiporter [Deltaproteobacteria bacterium]MCB9787085.1 cation:proton antiporter [Deltaproteobacteria bacterium]